MPIVQFLRTAACQHAVVRFAGGHEFTDEFRSAVGGWLEQRANGAR